MLSIQQLNGVCLQNTYGTYPKTFVCEAVDDWIGEAVRHGQPMATNEETGESFIRD